MFFSTLNYWVIGIATVIGMGFGFLWYSPWAFGITWMKDKKGPRSMKYAYPVTIISKGITAFVLATLFNSLIVTGFFGMFLVGALVWLGFSVPIKLSDYLFGGEETKSFLISIGYELLVILVMSFLIGIFG